MIDSDLSRIDLNLLVPLQALLRERSVSRAATTVGVTQPAMSNTLRRLRKLLGDALLIRVGGQYELTPRAREIVGPLDHSLASIRRHVVWPEPFDPRSANREFTIATSGPVAAIVLPRLIDRIERMSSTLRIRHVQFGMQPDELLSSRDIDVVLLPNLVDSVHPRQRLFEERWALTVSCNSSLSSSPTIEELTKYPFAIFDVDGRIADGVAAIAAAVRPLRVQVRTDDFLLLPLLVSATDLVALVQEPVAKLFEGSGMLRIVESPVALPAIRIDMLFPPGSQSDEGRQWLQSQLLGAASTLVD